MLTKHERGLLDTIRRAFSDIAGETEGLTACPNLQGGVAAMIVDGQICFMLANLVPELVPKFLRALADTLEERAAAPAATPESPSTH